MAISLSRTLHLGQWGSRVWYGRCYGHRLPGTRKLERPGRVSAMLHHPGRPWHWALWFRRCAVRMCAPVHQRHRTYRRHRTRWMGCITVACKTSRFLRSAFSLSETKAQRGKQRRWESTGRRSGWGQVWGRDS